MHTDEVTKDQIFKMRIDDEERLRLDALGRYYGTNGAGVVRTLLKKAHDEMLQHAEKKRALAQRSLLAERAAIEATVAKVRGASVTMTNQEDVWPNGDPRMWVEGVITFPVGDPVGFQGEIDAQEAVLAYQERHAKKTKK